MPVNPHLKFADESGDLLDILAVPFGGPFAGKDVDGEYFSPNTDLCLDWFAGSERPLLYHHGLDDDIQTATIGRVLADTAVKMDDGWWVKAQLDRRSKYYDRIKQLIDAGALNGSSGSMPHLVVRAKSGEIMRWPYVEQTVTTTPANLYSTVTVAEATKHYKSAGLDLDTDALERRAIAAHYGIKADLADLSDDVWDALKAKLSAEDRDALPDSAFAYIDSKGGKHLPVNDAEHVRAAVSRFNQTQFETTAKKRTAARKIRAAARKFGVSLSDGDLKSVGDIDFAIGAATIKALADPVAADGSVSAGEPNGDAPEGSYEDLIEDLNRAVCRDMAPGYGYVVATFPDFCIVRCLCASMGYGDDDDDDGPDYYRYDYTLDADGEPVLGESTPMEKRFVPAKSGDASLISLTLAADAATKTATAIEQRTRDLLRRRREEGRTLSAGNRQHLGALAAATKAAGERLDALLGDTPPARVEAPADVLATLAMRTRSLRLGLTAD